eukprot:jgi/Chlat1/6406/Chrsp45S05918
MHSLLHLLCTGVTQAIILYRVHGATAKPNNAGTFRGSGGGVAGSELDAAAAACLPGKYLHVPHCARQLSAPITYVRTLRLLRSTGMAGQQPPPNIAQRLRTAGDAFDDIAEVFEAWPAQPQVGHVLQQLVEGQQAMAQQLASVQEEQANTNAQLQQQMQLLQQMVPLMRDNGQTRRQHCPIMHSNTQCF